MAAPVNLFKQSLQEGRQTIGCWLTQGTAIAAEIAANHALAQRLQISGTPTFILADELIRGYVPLDSMQQFIAAAREG